MQSLLSERLINARVFGQYVVEDAYPALIVKYIGSEASGTVEVSSAGDITFKHGDLSSEAVDATIDSGGDDDGVIDVSDSNADTFGEVVDLINASANWRAYLVGALRADSANASTGSLLLKSATQAKVAGGVELYLDTSKVLHASVAVRGLRYPSDDFKENDAGQVVAETLEAAKFSEVTRLVYTPTGSGASTYEIHRVNRKTGTATKIVDAAGPSSASEQDTDLTDGAGRGIACDPDEYLVVRVKMASTLTAVKLGVLGRVI